MSLQTSSALSRVNLHYAIQAFAQAAGGVFLLAVLLKAGVSVPVALLFQAGIVAGRFVLRPMVLPLAKRTGIKPLLIAGTLATAAYYALFAYLGGPGPILILLSVVSSIGYLLYWLSFHAYFAAVGDPAQRGGQVGLREAMVAGVGVVAPLAGAWALTAGGPKVAFLLVGLVQALAIVPLIGAPNVPVARTPPEGYRMPRLGLGLMFGDGLFAAGYHFVWLIALFLTLGESYAAFGGAAAAAAVAGAAGALFLGRRIDTGRGRRAVVIAYAAAAVIIVLRALGVGTPWLAVLANAGGALMVALVTPVMMTPVYNLSKGSNCTLRFHIATEGAWDAGCFVGCVGAAGLVAAGLPLSVPILIALAAIALLVAQLMRYYGRLKA